MLLLVAEHGSIRQASLHARVDHATVRTRIDQLQSLIGVPLIEAPAPNQIELTQEALRLVEVARQMRKLVAGAKRAKVLSGFDAERFVCLSVSEGVGAFWLIPHMTRHVAHDDSMYLSTSTLSHSFQGVPSEGEVVVQLDRPLNVRGLHIERVGSLHVVPAASPAYVAEHGTPASLHDLGQHRFVWQHGDVTERASLRALIDFDFLRERATFLTESSLAHYLAVSDGCGIGLLPTYAEAVVPGALSWLNLGGRIRRDLYMVVQADCLRLPRCAAVMAAVRNAFDAASYPWFGEQFVDPCAFEPCALGAASRILRRVRS